MRRRRRPRGACRAYGTDVSRPCATGAPACRGSPGALAPSKSFTGCGLSRLVRSLEFRTRRLGGRVRHGEQQRNPRTSGLSFRVLVCLPSTRCPPPPPVEPSRTRPPAPTRQSNAKGSGIGREKEEHTTCRGRRASWRHFRGIQGSNLTTFLSSFREVRDEYCCLRQESCHGAFRNLLVAAGPIW